MELFGVEVDQLPRADVSDILREAIVGMELVAAVGGAVLGQDVVLRLRNIHRVRVRHGSALICHAATVLHIADRGAILAASTHQNYEPVVVLLGAALNDTANPVAR